MPNSLIFRRDRFLLSEPPRKGGGVLIALPHWFTASPLSLHISSTEQVAVLISNPIRLIIIVSYIPPASSLEVYLDHVTNVRHLADLYHDFPLCFMGDFNLPDTQWHPSTDPLSSAHFSTPSFKSHTICCELVGLGLYQSNFTPNSQNKVLDLLFTSTELISDCSPSTLELIPPDPLHPPLELRILNGQSPVPPSHSPPTFLNFRKADFTAMDRFFHNIDWPSVLSTTHDLSLAYSAFISIITHAIDLFVPVHSKGTRAYPPWFNSSYSKLLSAKARAHKRYKHTCADEDHALFVRLRKEASFLGNYLQRRYHHSIENGLRYDPKRFWNAVNSKRTPRSALPPVSYLTHSSSSDSESADLFASFFESVFVPPRPSSKHSNLSWLYIGLH